MLGYVSTRAITDLAKNFALYVKWYRRYNLLCHLLYYKFANLKNE